MHKVSVIIPSYNSGRYLSEAIDSVLSQTYADYEIIVVNDGSTDETASISRNYGSKIIYREQPNRGLSSARNTGIKTASGQFITFLDADDIYLPDKLKIQVNFLNENPMIGVVYSDGYRFAHKGKRVKEKLLSQTGEVVVPDFELDHLKFYLMVRNLFPVHVALVRKECILESGGFDENLTSLEDWDFWFRIAIKYPFSYLSDVVAKYRVTQGSMSSKHHQMEHMQAKVMQKISESSIFKIAPKHILSDFYFQRGLIDLALHDPQNAKVNFINSLKHNHINNGSRNALFLANILGFYTINFYYLKRILFGVHGLNKL